MKKTVGLLIALSLTLVGFTGCKSNEKSINLATKPMTEQFIVGSLFKQLVESKTDIHIEITEGVGGGTSNIHPGIKSKKFDIYPEYTGTGWNQVLKKTTVYNENLFDELESEYESMNLSWKGMLGFNNTFGLAVKKEIAEKYNLKTYSDLAAVANKLTFGAEYDFFEREDGYKALQDVYNIDFKSTTDLDIGLKYDAIAEGKIDAMNIFTTDGRLAEANLFVLKDDKQLYPSYMCGFVVRDEILKNHPQLTDILLSLENIINDEQMAKLNYKVEVLKEDIDTVALEYLKSSNLLD